MAQLIQIRRGTSSQWDLADPVLYPGEFGYNLDNNKVKIGNGTDSWSELEYLSGITAAGDATTLWLGTETEYAGIGSPDASTVYVVTPDP